jgi:hypothetical protein
MQNKGRLRVGADADITVFDPKTVADRGTHEKPVQPSAGIVTCCGPGRQDDRWADAGSDEAGRLCGYIEFDFRNTLDGGRTDMIRKVGPRALLPVRVLDQEPAPKEYAGAAGIGASAAEMKKRGFSDCELDTMFKDNPAKAIGLPPSTSF